MNSNPRIFQLRGFCCPTPTRPRNLLRAAPQLPESLLPEPEILGTPAEYSASLDISAVRFGGHCLRKGWLKKRTSQSFPRLSLGFSLTRHRLHHEKSNSIKTQDGKTAVTANDNSACQGSRR